MGSVTTQAQAWTPINEHPGDQRYDAIPGTSTLSFWGEIGPEADGGWSWTIMQTDDRAHQVEAAAGSCASEEEAKRAVERWRFVTERDQAYHDIFVTAIEGGINYWAYVHRYRWSLPDAPRDASVRESQDTLGFEAVILDTETEYDADKLPEKATMGDFFTGWSKREGDPARYATYKVDRAVIARGVGKFCAAMKDKPDSYFRRAALALDWGKWDELDVDAGIADAILQYGLFGEQVFG